MYGLVGLIEANLAGTVGDVSGEGVARSAAPAGGLLLGLPNGLVIWLLVGVLGALVGGFATRWARPKLPSQVDEQPIPVVSSPAATGSTAEAA